MTIFKKKDGNISSYKYKIPYGTVSYNADGAIKGSTSRIGNLTTFNNASFRPYKFKIKLGEKSIYYNRNWNQLK